MSAGMAAATGDPAWEDRYRQFEPALDAAIKEAMGLAPEAHGRESAAQTDAANLALVNMENKAFTLVRQGKREAASHILFSDRYEDQKQVYASGKCSTGRLEQIAQIESAIEDLDLEFVREEIPKAIEQTLSGVDRVAEIVRAMKDFSHPSGKEKTPTDLNMAIESTFAVCRNRWKYLADLENHPPNARRHLED